MVRKMRMSLLSSVVIAVLVISAFSPMIVLADGGTSSETSQPAETSSDCTSDGSNKCPSDGTAETSTDSGEAVATEAPAVKDAAAPAEDSGTAEEAAVAEEPVLAEVPEATTVTVLNAEGESEPLATQEAADAIAESDPVWCPEGQTPTPGANGCTGSFTSFSDLLGFMSGNASYQGPGTIYVQQGSYQGGESSIDLNSSSYDLSNIRNSNLTITGGWNTSSGAIDPAAPSSFTVPILVGTEANPWGGSLTVNNISIDSPSGNGLTLHSQADINLTNVSVTNSPDGVGADLNAGGNVTIESSNFVRNKVAGATIQAGASVAISNSNFSNRADGMRRLQIQGLDVTSGGSVSLFNVMAIHNREVGANIDAAGRVTIVQSVFSSTKTINSGQFLGYGLQVTTPDIIDLDTVTADDNFLWGASLNAGSDVNIINSIFNANTTESPGYIDDTGLLVTSGGNVSLQNVTANDNRLIGATIDATGDVSINNSSFSNNNGVTTASDGSPLYHGYGLQVTTPGNIFINLVTASNNTLYGAHLEAGSDVTISSSDFSNQTSNSDTEQIGRGLEVISGGNIFLDTITLNNNQTFGGNLQATGDIFLDTVTATGNGTDGLSLQATCAHVIGGTFSGNGGVGLNLGTSALDLVTQPTFGGNGQGDMVPATPPTCAPGGGIPGLPGGDPGFPVVVVGGSSSGIATIASLTGMSVQGGDLAGTSNLSLNAYLSNTRTGATSSNGLFIGRYAYVHSLAGLQILALVPDMQDLALR